jgi:hypothetical protein
VVVAGSDRRGTAFGVFDVSASIGVSPWVWWADVTPARRTSIVLARPGFTSKAPSIQYRGIFLNDEDWGLLPWSRRLDPAVNNIGPMTYERVGELMLRLKANYLWPAMHEPTTAFYQLPKNREVMDRYAIVVGSSHAEPMLYNNASEWKYSKDDWNYDTHADLIRGVWDKRTQEAKSYENVYTIGLRGVHDRPMAGSANPQDGVKRLERVFADQRAMLAKYVNPDATKVPQIFVPYKEVLPYYRAGLKVPDDVTLMWVDDNFGYIRQLSSQEERKRSGGAGVYYHFSYWGVPQDWLWLGSTSPALTAFEMGKAYAYDARKAWVFNVGDIKPIEKEMEFALRMAWDVDRYPADKAMGFLRDFAVENFGDTHADDIASILTEYYRLTAQIKPEHNDRMLLAPSELDGRLADYAALSRRAEALQARLPAERRDAFFQLVTYPVCGAALMNVKQTRRLLGDIPAADAAYDDIQRLTAIYNTGIAGAKWNGMMDATVRNERVFRRPSALDPQMPGVPGVPIALLAPAEGGKVDMAFRAPAAGKADVFLLTQTFHDWSNAWTLDVNGQKRETGGKVTGEKIAWIRLGSVDVASGDNRLTLSDRRGPTRFYRIAVMKAGEIPPTLDVATPTRLAQIEAEATVVIPAVRYRGATTTQGARWTKIEGLGVTGAAMTLLPYDRPSIDRPEAAPSLTYGFPAKAAQARLEVRFLPTHSVTPGGKLRYAISVDGGPVQIRSVDAPAEQSADWDRNVLTGYSRGITTHDLPSAKRDHAVTIRLLDPGMAISEVRVLAD